MSSRMRKVCAGSLFIHLHVFIIQSLCLGEMERGFVVWMDGWMDGWLNMIRLSSSRAAGEEG